MDSTRIFKVRTLSLILFLGGLVGITDRYLSANVQPCTYFPMIGGVILWLALGYLLYTKNVAVSFLIAIVATFIVFVGCFAYYGDPLYVMLGFSVPMGAALFMPTKDAVWVLFLYCFAAITIATGIRLELWEPPFLPAGSDVALNLKQTITGVAIIVAATSATIWREKLYFSPTDREKIQKSLFETVCDHGYDAIIQADHEGNITYTRGHLLAEFGYSEGNLLEQHQLSFMDAHDRESFLNRIKEINGHYQYDQETRIVDANGNPRWVRVSGGSFDDGSGNRQWVHGIREIEEQVKQREQLYEVARLESLGSVCAGLAHDFNNLLTVIGIHAGLIPDSKVRDNILQAQEQATRLTSGLLTFARKQEFREQRVSLSKFFDVSASLIKNIVRENIRFHWNVECWDSSVVIDPDQLQQVLINLVTNSQHAMPNGGRLEIGAKVVDVLPDGCLEESVAGKSYVALSVSDTGVGMDEETKRRAIEPFFTTKPRGEGTGLGLAMVHGIIQRSGGLMDIKSTLGFGTTITIFLPRANSKAMSGNDIAEHQETSQPNLEAKILLVEDQELVAQSISLTLTMAGAEVIVANDAESAIEILSVQSGFDAIVSDLVLPGISGVELIQFAIGQDPNLCAILISGHHQENLDFLKQYAGKVSFLAKPFSSKQLIANVRQLTLNGILGRRLQSDFG